MTIIKHSTPLKGPQYVSIENEELNNMATTLRRPILAGGQTEFQKCKKFVTMTLGFVIGFSICAWLTMNVYPLRKTVHVLYLQSNEPATYITNSKFLSIGLDSSLIADGFKNFDMQNIRLKNMIGNLGPGYLRVGGTLADRLRFDPKNKARTKLKYPLMQDGGLCSFEDFQCGPAIQPNFTLSGEEWLELYNLASGTAFEIVFDLNVLIRFDNGTWNYTNAKELIDFSFKNKMKLSWELGNEPNSFKHVFNYTVDANQLAEDYGILKELLQNAGYLVPFLVGPSITHPRPENKESMEYLRNFLSNGGKNVVNAITWHQYYFNGRTATIDQFVDPDIFNLLIAETNLLEGIVSRVSSGIPIWLGETAAAYGGGAPGYNNRYIGTFIWLDKLGVAAKMGLDVVVRQSIFKGFYALINGKDYQPTPDYWISVLYKLLVGPQVLPYHATIPPQVRLYCHCTNKAFQIYPSVTVYGMNMKSTEAVIRLEGFASPYYTTYNIYAFILTSHGTLLSKDIDLNDKKLELNEEGTLPMLKPQLLRHEDHVVMPPFSTAFFVIPTQEVLTGCKSWRD
ncbi:heparanase-like [Onthophagus taurus]|uniref:heparanase-like n=1 Tax=Onthophagus taurus TaxID=166361 RepID=UPI0039BDF467